MKSQRWLHSKGSGSWDAALRHKVGSAVGEQTWLKKIHIRGSERAPRMASSALLGQGHCHSSATKLPPSRLYARAEASVSAPRPSRGLLKRTTGQLATLPVSLSLALGVSLFFLLSMEYKGSHFGSAYFRSIPPLLALVLVGVIYYRHHAPHLHLHLHHRASC